jgi:hypothetical protein
MWLHIELFSEDIAAPGGYQNAHSLSGAESSQHFFH